MSRFGTYLSSQKLAKLLLGQAQDEIMKGEERKALRDTILAVGHFVTAMNCIASLSFEPRRKVRVSRAVRS